MTSGPHPNGPSPQYWDFTVVNTRTSADTTTDETITVTVTNPGTPDQTSAPLASDPQPAEIP